LNFWENLNKRFLFHFPFPIIALIRTIFHVLVLFKGLRNSLQL
jgi:hypothetical protein